MDEENIIKLLSKFKNRIKIFHDDENDMLKDILKSSEKTLKNAIGCSDLKDDSFVNLLLIRAMYVFNDQGEYFFENYRSEINDVALNYGGNANDIQEPTKE